jgi:hypothetical protein
VGRCRCGPRIQDPGRKVPSGDRGLCPRNRFVRSSRACHRGPASISIRSGPECRIGPRCVRGVRDGPPPVNAAIHARRHHRCRRHRRR